MKTASFFSLTIQRVDLLPSNTTVKFDGSNQSGPDAKSAKALEEIRAAYAIREQRVLHTLYRKELDVLSPLRYVHRISVFCALIV